MCPNTISNTVYLLTYLSSPLKDWTDGCVCVSCWNLELKIHISMIRICSSQCLSCFLPVLTRRSLCAESVLTLCWVLHEWNEYYPWISLTWPAVTFASMNTFSRRLVVLVICYICCFYMLLSNYSDLSISLQYRSYFNC